jgi:hypothetical protein
MTRSATLGSFVSVLSLLVVAACSSDRSTAPPTSAAPPSGPEFDISDAAHEGGTPGFFFLPPMVRKPFFSGTFDADIATLNPVIAICDITNGPDANCGATGGTPAVLVLTTTSTPAITVDLTTSQYQVNWSTRGASFTEGHTYRVHVTAGATGTRRELGFADVFLTTTPGQAKNVETGDIIVLNDGRTLPIHFRIETGIPGSLAVSAATASVMTGGTDLITATVRDLHGALLAGGPVAWSVTTTPVTGVADATQPLNPPSGQTDATGTTATTFKAGTTGGTAVVAASSAGVSATATVTVIPPHLVFILPPVTQTAGVPFVQPVLVAIEDLLGNTITTATNSVTLALGANLAGGTLSGTTTVAAVNGIATFADLSINIAHGYTLTASATGLTGTTSSAFAVVNPHLVFTIQPPGDVPILIAFAVQVRIADHYGSTITTATNSVRLAIETNPGYETCSFIFFCSTTYGDLSGTTTVAAVNGVATFFPLLITVCGEGYTLRASATGVTGRTSDPFDVTEFPFVGCIG